MTRKEIDMWIAKLVRRLIANGADRADVEDALSGALVGSKALARTEDQER